MFTIGFDLDLTLIDSRQRILTAAQRAFADLGYTVDDAVLLPHMGVPIDDVAREVVPAVRDRVAAAREAAGTATRSGHARSSTARR